MVVTRRGFTVIECMVALSVITIILTAVLGGDEAQRQGIAHALDDLQAHLAAASRLETLQDEAAVLEVGTHDIDLVLPSMRGRETVTRLAEGLYEVRVTVKTTQGVRKAELVTRLAREAKP